MNEKKLKPNHIAGFTLVETLVATVIFVVVITVVVATFGFGSSLQNKNLAIKEASQNVRFIIEAIARDVRLADSFIVSDDGKTITIEKNNQELKYYLSEDGNIYYTDAFNVNYPLNSSSVTIDNLDFFGVDEDVQQSQSYLGIEIDFGANIGSGKKTETAKQTIKTTVTTRAYNKGFDSKITQ